MALTLKTFSNTAGGSTLFKALGHPLAAGKGHELVDQITAAGPVALYDPWDAIDDVLSLYDLGEAEIAGLFVQDVTRVGTTIRGMVARPVTDLADVEVDTVFVLAFDADRPIDNIRHLIPQGTSVVSLDALRIPEELLTNSRQYLSPLNFATNFAFFREGEGHHTRVATANYWSGYGATDPKLWLCLFDANGQIAGHWMQSLRGAGGSVVIDSRQVRDRLDLPTPFLGQLFIQVVGGAGHDVVKYALDTTGDAGTVLSCTHDANAWPSERYAGLPAPDRSTGDQVILWVQNSHPCPIPSGGVGLSLMGSEEIRPIDRDIPGFATMPLDVATLYPDAAWPQQFEVHAGFHMVRPRYEIVMTDGPGAGRRRIAHVNVERSDLRPDPRIPTLKDVMGKGYILPAPILPTERYKTIALPTPMSMGQSDLPLLLSLYDASGDKVAERFLGRIDRADSVAVDLDEMLDSAGGTLKSGLGHLELTYDFRDGGGADGWLHAIFRYHDRQSGHVAETSFGAHIFNTVMVFGKEPQSYAGRPPGLSTRLFLRVGEPHLDTLCHLIYPASTPWHSMSETTLALVNRNGDEVAHRTMNIPCGGSALFSVGTTFSADDLGRAGPDPSVLIRDMTCRLFGYHGLAHGDEAFSLDHMFGF